VVRLSLFVSPETGEQRTVGWIDEVVYGRWGVCSYVGAVNTSLNAQQDQSGRTTSHDLTAIEGINGSWQGLFLALCFALRGIWGIAAGS
jgi:hypothetical protein